MKITVRWDGFDSTMDEMGKNIIETNRELVLSRMAAAAKRSGRNLSDIRLVAVSKTKPASMILDAIQVGIDCFGENKVQEILEKQEDRNLQYQEKIEWHMIGHLQTNKVRQIIDRVTLIHSVDRLDLAVEIQKQALKKAITVPVLVQVNVAREESKQGFFVEEAENAIRAIACFPNICIKGLMTIAPFRQNPADNRGVFRDLYNFFLDIDKKKMDNVSMCTLSMGMSNDFEIAIEEGANLVRIGSLLFGERSYTKEGTLINK